MISLITFPDLKVLPKEEAEELGLAITKVTRFGLKDGVITPMKYDKDVFEGELGVGVTIDPMYLYYHLPNNYPDYVELEEYQLVDIAKFAAICDKPFTVIRSINPADYKSRKEVISKGTTIEWFKNIGEEPGGNWVVETADGAILNKESNLVHKWQLDTSNPIIRYFLLE